MPIVEPASKTYLARGMPLSQVALRGDLQWLAIAWTMHNCAQIVAAGATAADNQAASRSILARSGRLPAPDPTRGATHFHRHDEQPTWARLHQPVALIGDFLFYKIDGRD